MKKRNLFVLMAAFACCGPTVAQGVAQPPVTDKRKNAVFFSDGLQCKYREDVQGAIRNFENALKYMPDDAASMYELSEQYANDDRASDALTMIAKAVELDPDNKWYKMRLGTFYRNFEMYDELIALYEGLTRDYPDDLDMLSELIDAFLITERYDKALEKIDLFEVQTGPNELVDEQRFAIYQRMGNSKQLIAELNDKIKKNPTHSRYYSILAQIYMENGKEKEALKMFEKVKELDPDDPYIDVSLLEYYEKKGNRKKAFEQLVATIRNKNLDLNTKVSVFDYWFNKAEQNQETNLQAFECGQAFVEAYPDNKIGYKTLMKCYILQDKLMDIHKMSEKVLDIDSADYMAWEMLVYTDMYLKIDTVYEHSAKALEYYPMHPLFNLFVGEKHAMDGQNEEAVAYFEKGRKYCADKNLLPLFDQSLGDLYHQLGDDEKAFEAYDRYLESNPNEALVLNNYAYYLSLRGERLDDALTMAKKATETCPENVYYLDTYAWVLYQLGRYAEAKQWMEKCIQSGGCSGTDWEHYGDILFKLGDRQGAMEQWKKAKAAGEYSDKLELKLQDGQLYE